MSAVTTQAQTKTGFTAKSQSPKEWKTATAAIQTLVEEATFDVSVDGIAFRAMDPSHVGLVDLFWPMEDFEKFVCEKGDSFTVRMEDFAKLVRRAENKDTFEVSRLGTESLQIKIGGSREFELHLIETSKNPTPLPKLVFDATLVMPESVFDRAMNDVAAVSNHITIESDKDKVVFSGKGDTGKAQVLLQKVDGKAGDLIELTCAKDTKATYSIEYLAKITKAAGAGVIKLEYSTKMPIRLEFKLGENSKGKIQFYLAPRVQE